MSDMTGHRYLDLGPELDTRSPSERLADARLAFTDAVSAFGAKSRAGGRVDLAGLIELGYALVRASGEWWCASHPNADHDRDLVVKNLAHAQIGDWRSVNDGLNRMARGGHYLQR